MTEPLLTWMSTEPGVSRSICGRYVINLVTLPENPPRNVYQTRRVDDAMAAAYPTSATMGYLLEESPWLTLEENSVHSAQAVAERHAWSEAQGSECHVPEDLPSEALERFYWPISDGTTLAGLAIVRENGRVYARVVGQGRKTDRFETLPFVQIDVTDMLDVEARDELEKLRTAWRGLHVMAQARNEDKEPDGLHLAYEAEMTRLSIVADALRAALKRVEKNTADAREAAKRLNQPMLARLRTCAADTSSNWKDAFTVYPPSARGLAALIDAVQALAADIQAVHDEEKS